MTTNQNSDTSTSSVISDPTLRFIKENNLVADVAAACGMTRQAFSQWRKVPPTRVLTVEKVTGIPRHEIRPDLYPPPS